jgi:hypothetical protein
MDDNTPVKEAATVEKLCAYLDSVPCQNQKGSFFFKPQIYTTNYLEGLHGIFQNCFHAKVIAKKNLGVHLNEVFKDREVMKQAPGRLIRNVFETVFDSLMTLVSMSWFPFFVSCFEALDKLVMCQPDEGHKKNMLTAVPTSSISEFWLPLESFDYSENCKNGCASSGY